MPFIALGRIIAAVLIFLSSAQILRLLGLTIITWHLERQGTLDAAALATKKVITGVGDVGAAGGKVVKTVTDTEGGGSVLIFAVLVFGIIYFLGRR